MTTQQVEPDRITERLDVPLDTLRAAFSEWDRRWREEPQRFTTDVQRILSGQTCDEYGDSATLTLLAMIEAVSS